jgi:S1-C subfamily serine protease
MAKQRSPVIPVELQPKSKDFGFDIDRVLSSVVGLKSIVPQDAFTARTLGTEREGHGIVLRQSGLVLTMGYLVVEAESIWLRTIDGRVVQGHTLAYDQETGFGLVQAMSSLDLPILPIGASRDLSIGDRVLVAGAGGRDMALSAQLVARQEFAGYWEYALDEALFTAPAHPFWGGGAVIDERGRLIGIASLQVEHGPRKNAAASLNMVVPIDILPPVLDDLVKSGRANRPARPWLGLYATEVGERLVIAGVADGGPAEKAGLESGDILIAINDERPKSLAELWRRIWALGPAGVDVSILVERESKILSVTIKSADRLQFSKAPVLH